MGDAPVTPSICVPGAAPPIYGRLLVSLPPRFEFGGKILGAEGAVLFNFSDFSKKLFLKHAIKAKHC